MVTRGTALAEWRAHLEEAIGVAEAAALVDPFETVDWSELATKRDLERFATKEDVARFATKEDVARFATKEDLERFATKEDVARCATKEDLERFATKEDLARTLETVQAWLDVLRGELHATREAMARFATKEDLETLRATVDVLRGEIHAAEERSNARLSEAIRGVSDRFNDTVRKQTWAIVVGMPAMLVALFTLAQMLP